jgi:hypothetical protein
MQGFYRLKWWGQETTIGATQAAFQGSPISTCLSVIGSSSACSWAEGRGNFVKFSRAANGDFVRTGVVNNARTDPFFQTDLNLVHEIKVSKTHENYRLVFEGNALNLFNQHSAVAFNQIPFASAVMVISPTRAARFAGDPQIDWNKVMRAYDYVSEINAEAKAGSNLTLASRYGLPQIFQTARNFRLAVRFVF